MTPRPPWSQRQTAESIEQFFVLREGVPEGFLHSLLGIIDIYYDRSPTAWPVLRILHG